MKKGFYFNDKNVNIAQKNIQQFTWAKKQYDTLMDEAEGILAINDETIYDCVIQMKHETFAYGISGCPHCKKPFPQNPDEQRDMFSPFAEWQEKRITCPNCHTVFPNESYNDNGQGLEVAGKGYYLIGMWNFYYGGELLGGVRNHEGLVTKLTYAYMLTGEVKYANKALVILDAFSAIMPHTIGPRDFTPFTSDYLIGRVHLLTSIVHRIKVCLAAAYDWLYDVPLLKAVSPALQRLGDEDTIQGNIENMLNDYMLTEPGGPYYDLRDGNLTNLQNHEADGVRAMLAVGLVLGEENYCNWGKQALEAYFFNTIGRDGMYYEGSFGYALFTATVFLDMALLGMNASTEKELETYHPFSCKRLFKFCIVNPLKMLCRGHLPSYGDWGRDTATSNDIDTNVVIEVYRAAQYFYQYSRDQSLKQRAKKYLNELYSQVESELGHKGVDLFFQHCPDENQTFKLSSQSTFMGQAGLGIIRDANDTALLMRVGQNNTHAHDDVLGLNYYALGKEISADIGYGIFATNGHFGWNTKAIAHNTVVVNEDKMVQENQLYKPFSGGEWRTIYENDDLKVMEGSAPDMYQIDDYSRLVGVVPVLDQLSYCIDFFNVKGSKIADYSLHAFHEQSEIELKNATCMSENTPWTLAGLTETGLYFDQEGMSFGERLTTGETFSETLLDEKNQGWTPKKNNGYGYIYQLQEYMTHDNILNVDWTSKKGYRMCWSGVVQSDDRIFTGLGPSLEGDVQHPYLIIRNTKSERCFASMFYTTRMVDKQKINFKQIQVVQPGATAVVVELPNGHKDYWLYAQKDGNYHIQLPSELWQVTGRVAMIRVDRNGTLVKSACIDAEQMTYQQTVIEGIQKRQYPIVSVDVHRQIIEIDGKLPEKSGRFLTVKSSNYANPPLYPIETMHKNGSLVTIKLADSLILSKGKVVHQDEKVLVTSYPLPLAFDEGTKKSSFTGKLVIGENGGKALIERVLDLKTLEITLLDRFVKGEQFSIIDIQKGDDVQFV